MSLDLAFYILCATVVAGSALALPYLRITVRRMPWPVRAETARAAADIAQRMAGYMAGYSVPNTL